MADVTDIVETHPRPDGGDDGVSELQRVILFLFFSGFSEKRPEMIRLAVRIDSKIK